MEQVETAEFAAHIEAAVACVERALERAREQGSDFAGVVFHAGSQRYYHADDRPIPFKPAAHFARFAPLATPGHTVVVEPGKTPKLIQVVPRDFWHETPAPLEHPYRDVLEVVEVAAAGDVRAHLGAVKDLAFVGADHDLPARETLAVVHLAQVGHLHRPGRVAAIPGLAARFAGRIAWRLRAKRFPRRVSTATRAPVAAAAQLQRGALGGRRHTAAVATAYVAAAVSPTSCRRADGRGGQHDLR